MVDRLIGLDWLGWQVYPVLHAAWQGTMVKGFVEGTMPASGLANPVHPFLTTHTYTSYESVATMLKLKHLKACQQHCTSKNALRFLNWCIDVNTHLVKVAFVAIFFFKASLMFRKCRWLLALSEAVRTLNVYCCRCCHLCQPLSRDPSRAAPAWNSFFQARRNGSFLPFFFFFAQCKNASWGCQQSSKLQMLSGPSKGTPESRSVNAYFYCWKWMLFFFRCIECSAQTLPRG